MWDWPLQQFWYGMRHVDVFLSSWVLLQYLEVDWIQESILSKEEKVQLNSHNDNGLN